MTPRFATAGSRAPGRWAWGVRPLNQLADDGDLTVGNPRDPIPVIARCVMDRNDVHARDGTHYRWNVLRRVVEICGLVAMAPSLEHI